MSIDKESMTDVILNDGSKPLNALVASDWSFSPDEDDFRDVDGDFNDGAEDNAQDMCKKDLSEQDEDSKAVSLTVTDYEEHQKIDEYVKDQVESNLDGISVEIDKVPFEARLEKEKDVDYDMVISTWGPDYNDPMTFLDMWLTDGSANRMD